MIIAGVDPGRDGYIVVLDALSSRAWSQKLTYCSNKILQFEKLMNLPKIDLCYIEKVQGRGGWAAAANFGLGSYYGQIVLALKLYGVDYELIRPTEWTKQIHGEYKGSAKQKTLKTYLEMFPHMPIEPRFTEGKANFNHNLIDSFMIAVNGVLKNSFYIQKWNFEE